MIHRISVFSNPGIIITGIILLIATAGAVLAALFLNVLAGIIILGVTIYFGNSMLKYIRPIIGTYIISDDLGISAHFYGGEKKTFLFTEITHSGICVDDKNKETIYIYDSKIDSYISIPPQYSGFEIIKEALSGHCDFETYNLESGQDIKDKLKEISQVSG